MTPSPTTMLFRNPSSGVPKVRSWVCGSSTRYEICNGDRVYSSEPVEEHLT